MDEADVLQPLDEGEVLRATVHELVLAFRDGLTALVPVADRVLMAWRDEYQHPDWERVADAMFHSCVRSPIEVDTNRVRDEFPLAKYDIDYETYADLSWIAVHCPTHWEPLAFVRFLSHHTPFDTIQAATLDPTTSIATGRIELPLQEATFTYTRQTPTATYTITSIEAAD